MLVIQEIAPGEYPFYRLHFALELLFNMDQYYLDFAANNKVVFREGTYEHHQGYKSVQEVRLKIDPNQSIAKNVREHFEPVGFNFDRLLERLKQDNTLQNYMGFLASNDGSLQLE